jgi:hypothetical protein
MKDSLLDTMCGPPTEGAANHTPTFQRSVDVAPVHTHPVTGKFLPGNKAAVGRAVPLAALIKSRTGDGVALVDFFLRVIDGDLAKKARISDRVTCAQYLADHLWGKAKQPIAGVEGEPLQIEVIRTALIERLTKMAPPEGK